MRESHASYALDRPFNLNRGFILKENQVDQLSRSLALGKFGHRHQQKKHNEDRKQTAMYCARRIVPS